MHFAQKTSFWHYMLKKSKDSQLYHKMMQNAFCFKNVVLPIDFGETVEIKTDLSQNHAKRS